MLSYLEKIIQHLAFTIIKEDAKVGGQMDRRTDTTTLFKLA